MKTFQITNKKDNEKYLKSFEGIQQAKEWAIAHLDLSKNWSIVKLDKIEIIMG